MIFGDLIFCLFEAPIGTINLYKFRADISDRINLTDKRKTDVESVTLVDWTISCCRRATGGLKKYTEKNPGEESKKRQKFLQEYIA